MNETIHCPYSYSFALVMSGPTVHCTPWPSFMGGTTIHSSSFVSTSHQTIAFISNKTIHYSTTNLFLLLKRGSLSFQMRLILNENINYPYNQFSFHFDPLLVQLVSFPLLTRGSLSFLMRGSIIPETSRFHFSPNLPTQYILNKKSVTFLQHRRS